MTDGLTDVQPGEERIGELAHVPFAVLALEALERLTDERRLAVVGERLLGDVLEVAGAQAGREPELVDLGVLLVLGKARERPLYTALAAFWNSANACWRRGANSEDFSSSWR